MEGRNGCERAEGPDKGRGASACACACLLRQKLLLRLAVHGLVHLERVRQRLAAATGMRSAVGEPEASRPALRLLPLLVGGDALEAHRIGCNCAQEIAVSSTEAG